MGYTGNSLDQGKRCPSHHSADIIPLGAPGWFSVASEGITLHNTAINFNDPGLKPERFKFSTRTTPQGLIDTKIQLS